MTFLALWAAAPTGGGEREKGYQYAESRTIIHITKGSSGDSLSLGLADVGIATLLTFRSDYGKRKAPSLGDRERFRLKEIQYVMLGASDLDRSLSFYQGVLGLALNSTMPGWAFPNTGAVTLCLSEQLGESIDRSAGATEVVFTVDDIHKAHRNLHELGVEFDTDPHPAAEIEWAANFRDPDGHSLTIFGPNRSE